jgi:hypothetical protein
MGGSGGELEEANNLNINTKNAKCFITTLRYADD